MNIGFQYSIGEKIRLIEIDRPGTVIGLLFNHNGPQYQVVYWEQGNRKIEWVFQFEIEGIKK